MAVASSHREGTDALRRGHIVPSRPRRLSPYSPSTNHNLAGLIGFAVGSTGVALQRRSNFAADGAEATMTIGRIREVPHVALREDIASIAHLAKQRDGSQNKMHMLPPPSKNSIPPAMIGMCSEYKSASSSTSRIWEPSTRPFVRNQRGRATARASARP